MNKYIIPLFVTIVFIFFYIKGEINESNTLSHHGFATGEVYDYAWGSRAGVTLYYTFKNEGQSFNGGQKIYIGKQFAYRFKGKTFPVAYNTEDPSISTLLIEAKDFRKFGLEFPDSLNWAIKYF